MPTDTLHRDAELLDVLKTGFDLGSDAQVAAFLGITRTTIHSVRHGKARLGIVQRLKILDHIGFLHSRQWLESLLPDNLSARIRRTSHALAQRQVRSRQRITRDLDVEGELLDLVQDACGFRTDAELAEFLGVARNTLSNVRAGRGSLGPRPRLRILNRFAPFDTERVDAVLNSTDALIAAVQEWMERDHADQE
ncbi:bacteriophage CI repressor [Thiorhodococcus minor]|uniref:Bacteriophage CI repressor n=1 Tax=Thiorhodococcus minor TaxID=57489 RepID=A0A6M0JS28_9GAMM|nr:bacteriophage CI repressor [Thiorhodococcus minor]NEV60316.1 bacteriophage CI repressor [Thiorhodococcus minor]